MITPAQIRAGRAMLGVKQSDLAMAAGLSLATLNNIERGLSDPRASTLEALARALAQAGIECQTDSLSHSVHFSLAARPAVVDSLHASQQILDAMRPSALLKPQSIHLFACSNETSSPDATRFCVLIEGKERALLYDHTALVLDGSVRAAEIAGIVLATVLLYRQNSYYLPHITADTSTFALQTALSELRTESWTALEDPADFLSLFRPWDDLCRDFAEIPGHPIADLLALRERLLATPA